MKKIGMHIVIILNFIACAGGNFDVQGFPPSISYDIPLGQLISNVDEAFNKPKRPNNFQSELTKVSEQEYQKLLLKASNESMPECFSTIEKAIRIKPQRPEAYILKGDLLIDHNKNYKEALTYYEQAILFDPTNAKLKRKIEQVRINLSGSN